MKSYCIINRVPGSRLPQEFHEDGRFDEGLLRYLIHHYTNIGDFILDPFAGYGTTLKVADEMNRRCGGAEIDLQRFQYIQTVLNNPLWVYHKSVLDISKDDFPPIDCVITSPPYSWKQIDINTFSGNKTQSAYLDYLSTYSIMIERIIELVKPGGSIILDTCNVLFQSQYTTTAWDIYQQLKHLPNLSFVRELVVCWESDEPGFLGGNYGFGCDHSYCLIYKKQ